MMTGANDVKRKPKPQELFEEHKNAFNKNVAEGNFVDLVGANLSDLDLRGFNLNKQNLTNCYLRGANLAGVDFSESILSGASLKNAHVSGCLFPKDLLAAEILLSIVHGTRLRHR